MKSLHVGSILCFFIAAALYSTAWLPGAWGLLAVLGVCFEIAAWLCLWESGPR